MKFKIISVFLLVQGITFSQETDTTKVFKKRVLESTEVDFTSSYYSQDGRHSAVGGGIGSEDLQDFAANIVVSTPLNDDDVLTVDLGISAYSSASSSNINPFNTGASGKGGDDDDDDDKLLAIPQNPSGTPWQASSGASRYDQLKAVSVNYQHSSDNRNLIWNADVSISNEYDYDSRGIGGGITKLFNNKNSEISLKANAYIDKWKPIYPTELSEFNKYGTRFQSAGYFAGVLVYDHAGLVSTSYLPNNFKAWDSAGRNSYAASIIFSQVLTKVSQFSIFLDILQQEGKLSTPYQRVYFADKANYYIGNIAYIPVYSTPNNKGVYQLADDIERLPNSRFKLPVGMRWNYYLTETFVLKTYYRYYQDNWDIKAHTFSVELPIKLSDMFTIYPMYRYYAQNQSKYFAPFETHLSTEIFYTSDYDLSTFQSNQYGIGANYTDILGLKSIFGFNIKNIDFRFNHYSRTDGLVSNIASIAVKLVNN